MHTHALSHTCTHTHALTHALTHACTHSHMHTRSRAQGLLSAYLLPSSPFADPVTDTTSSPLDAMSFSGGGGVLFGKRSVGEEEGPAVHNPFDSGGKWTCWEGRVGGIGMQHSCSLVFISHSHGHTYTHMHTHTQMYTHTHVHTYTCTHIHMYTHTHVHTYTHIRSCTHMHIRTVYCKMKLILEIFKIFNLNNTAQVQFPLTCSSVQ